MAEYPIIMKQKNDQGQYDTLYPKTLGSQVQGNIQASQIAGNIPSSQITGTFPASQITGIYTADETLTDAVASMFGFSADAVPNDMFNVLAHAGDLHVWKRTQNGQVDYPVSPDRNAYQEGSDAQPAGYTLGEVQSGKFYFTTQANVASGTSVSYYYNNSISVNDDGTISMPNGSSIQGVSRYNSDTSSASVFKGKFIQAHDASSSALYGSFSKNVIYYIPSSATVTLDTTSYAIYVNQYQSVTGYPAIPAGTTIEYMGQLGNKSQIETGSYTGTGTYGKNNPNSLTFGFEPKVVIVSMNNGISFNYYGSTAGFNNSFIWTYGNEKIRVVNSGVYELMMSLSGNTLSWYCTVNSNVQCNTYNYTYYYIAIG